jgi:large subunit ribosomal protein L3
MSGHMGNVKRTVINQEIVRIDAERHLLFISGGIPGAPGGYVKIMPSSRVKAAESQ